MAGIENPYLLFLRKGPFKGKKGLGKGRFGIEGLIWGGLFFKNLD